MRHQLYWTPERIATRLALIRPLAHRRAEPIPAFRYAALAGPEAPPPVGPDVDTSAWAVLEPECYWGAWATDFALRTAFRVPGDWGDGPVALYLPLGEAGDIFNHPEALVYIDGKPVGSADRYHHEITLPDDLSQDQEHELTLHGWTGLSSFPPGSDRGRRLYMRQCSIVQIDPPTRELIVKAEMALDIAASLDDSRPERQRLLTALDDAFMALDLHDPLGGEGLYASARAALEILASGLKEAGDPMNVDIVAVGHAHIDIAYLWPVSQTRRKCGRTFSNALRLMEMYPDYHFSNSQAQLYSFVEEDYPEIFRGIQERVEEGRWEPIGGMWVEADCNITGAESLVRQLLLGQRYFQARFGEGRTPVLWLPDTFGFTWSLPQLMKQAGLKWFVTNKVSWNQVNPMPAHMTWWQGIDGTRVLAHFLTTPREVEYLPFPSTYKSDLSAAEVMGTWLTFRQKASHGELLLAYGYGDGGGGPTREQVERAQVLSHMPGAPQVRMGTVREFFERIEREVAERLPVWNDEIHLELHRGTLTSQARTKRANRRCEMTLHDAEFLAAYAALAGGATYPHAPLADAWRRLCLNHFHDVLPGTSITEVHAESEQDLADIERTAASLRQDSLDALAGSMSREMAVLVANPTGFSGDRLGILPATLEHGLSDLRDRRAVPTQQVAEGTLVALSSLPSYGLVALGPGPASTGPTGLTIIEDGDGVRIENRLLRFRLSPAGEIVELWDKDAERAVLARGCAGNQIQAFEDRPLNWDAWDIDLFYEDHMEVIGAEGGLAIIERGPLRAMVEVVRHYRSSRIIQRISLRADSKRIDFDTVIDWRESHILLKAAFPVAVCAQRATYDIQWGNIERPTHRNTPWDWAQFEVAAHKWTDLSEGDYGVALLNDCKYGHDIQDHVMRLSLLKSATMPDPIADQGEHRMTYCLLPHRGDWRNGVPEQAYALNDPPLLRLARGGAGDVAVRQLVATDRRNAVIETVKQAEDGNGIIVRLYENERCRGPVTVRFGFPVAGVRRCSLLEEDGEDVPVADDAVEINLHPYEIVSLRCVPV